MDDFNSIPPIDRYCNNDALGVIFEYVGGFDLLATVPFVCKRWRKVAQRSPLQFGEMKGWAFALPDSLIEEGRINVSILASTKNKEFIPYRDLHENKSGLYSFIKSIYWISSDTRYILGTFKFSDDTPIFYFALEKSADKKRDIILHSDLFELLCYGVSLEMKESMKTNYFDKLVKPVKKRRFKPYRTYRKGKPYKSFVRNSYRRNH